MISTEFQEACSAQWLNIHVPKQNHELIILRKIFPWQWLIQQLSHFYSPDKGKIGSSLRNLVAVVILQFVRRLSDRKVVEGIQENRYMQYFCNVPDRNLNTFIHPTTLVKFRQRLGINGISLIEDGIFDALKGAGIIKGEDCLMDSTVLESNILYPTDVHLLWKALKKIQDAAHRHRVKSWWDIQALKKRWRVFNLDKKTPLAEYLQEFFAYFIQVRAGFETFGADWPEYTKLSPLFLY